MSPTPSADPLGAFVPGQRLTLGPERIGPLQGLRFAVKDIFDVAGHVTGCGNPDWLRTHGPAAAHAAALEALLAAGAEMIGKTVTDELAYSVNGQNHHYGTPTNVNAPGRIPGGSSCGSAAAVAGGLCDFALGSDTGGSVRLPASYCGLYGLRPTHGRVAIEGVMPLAPSFDTVGWFTREASLMRRVGEVLLGPDRGPEQAGFRRLLVAEDALAQSEAAVRSALTPLIERLELRLGPARSVRIGEPGGGLEQWMWRFRTIQGHEIWQVHGPWVEATQPHFGPDIAERFAWASSVSEDDARSARPERQVLTTRLEEMLAPDALLLLPTAPGIAPLLTQSEKDKEQHRGRAVALTCVASLTGLPQVTLPLAQVQGCPAGLSLMAARGRDAALLAFAEAFSAAQAI